jgi:pimeloyl-ACP methyl ester carboxylesterase
VGQQYNYDRFVAPDGVALAYRVSGAGEPVILVHGYPVTSTTNFATHYRDDGSGGLVAADGPTIESALIAAGRQVIMLDNRGHGHSDRPHDPGRYSPEIFADDVRALVVHLGIERAALAGYSFGGQISCHLLADPWVSRAALCGVGSWSVEGEAPDYAEERAAISACFLDDKWDEYPDLTPFRSWASLDGSAPDFAALGAVARAQRPIPMAALSSASVPVLVLNGGGDEGALDEWDLTRFIRGASRVVAGTCHHGTAPSDPAFQAELVRFITGAG